MSHKGNNTSRVGYIDIFRGIGIILMVLDHIGIGAGFYHFIHAFHMPMFFFISGYCYHEKSDSISYQIRRKARSLLVPYVVFGILQFILWLIYKGDSILPLVHLFWDNTDGLAIAGALWFLTALFFTEIMYTVLCKICRHNPIKVLLVVAISVLGCFLPQMCANRLPYGIDVAMVGLGFYYIGHIVRNMKVRAMVAGRIPLALEIAIIPLVIYLIISSPSVNMRTGNYALIPLFWINSLLSVLVILNISMCIDKILDISYLKKIGRNGIIYVCFNQLAITVVETILTKLGLSAIVYYVAAIVLVFVILDLISRVIYGTKLRTIIGK